MAPVQKPGRSEQVVLTPPSLIKAVCKRLAIVGFSADLAADKANSVAPMFYSESQDALKEPWNFGGWAWCNPPFENIAPWVGKACDESQYNGAKIAMLLPASVGANWWRDAVHMNAHVWLLTPRITFVGHSTPYPKDLAIALYQPGIYGGYEYFNWKSMESF